VKIGLFTEFSYPGKTEIQAYRDVMEQAVLADELGYYFFSTTESFGKDEISCSPFPLGHYVAMGQRTKRIRFEVIAGRLGIPKYMFSRGKEGNIKSQTIQIQFFKVII